MKKGLIVILVALFFCGVVLQQANAVSLIGKIATKWGEIKSKILEKNEKQGEPAVLIMGENEFAMTVNRYLAENQDNEAKLAPIIPIGPYGFEITFEYPGHPLQPCVSQSVPHLNIHVYKNGTEVYNIHLGAYRNTGTSRFTLVFFGQNKINKISSCKQFSFPSLKDLKNGFNNVKNFIEDGLKNMNASLGYAIPAIAIIAAAYVITTVVFSVLVPILA